MMFIILNYVIPLIFFLYILWFYSLRFASDTPLVSSKSIAQTIFLHRLLHSYLHSKFFWSAPVDFPKDAAGKEFGSAQGLPVVPAQIW